MTADDKGFSPQWTNGIKAADTFIRLIPEMEKKLHCKISWKRGGVLNSLRAGKGTRNPEFPYWRISFTGKKIRGDLFCWDPDTGYFPFETGGYSASMYNERLPWDKKKYVSVTETAIFEHSFGRRLLRNWMSLQDFSAKAKWYLVTKPMDWKNINSRRDQLKLCPILGSYEENLLYFDLNVPDMG